MREQKNEDFLLDPHLARSEEHTSELQSQSNLVCRLLLEKQKKLPDFSKSHAITSSLFNPHSVYLLERPVLALHSRPSPPTPIHVYAASLASSPLHDRDAS